MPYAEVLALRKERPIRPKRPNRILRGLINLISASELKKCNFKYNTVNMDKLGKREPCLILMNHSCFTDLKIAQKIIPRRFNIVTTSDGFVGKRGLLRNLGCIPTTKFVTDATLVRNMIYCLRTLKTSVLMYPEASYSFDGTATTLPQGLGKCIKILRVPVVVIITCGAFLHDPLYNGLQLRTTDISATMTCALTVDRINSLTPAQINKIIGEYFAFDNFAEQQRTHTRIAEPFRADGLNRVLYKCPHCNAEGEMCGSGTTLTCRHCGAVYTLDEYGFMQSDEKTAVFSHIPDWYGWQRECVRREITDGTYRLDIAVRIYALKGTKAVYDVGCGRLVHDLQGFALTSDDGAINYTQPPQVSYSLYSDFYWYQIDDVICIGNNDMLYYCFPLNAKDVVAKTRLAAEELYKLCASK